MIREHLAGRRNVVCGPIAFAALVHLSAALS